MPNLFVLGGAGGKGHYILRQHALPISIVDILRLGGNLSAKEGNGVLT